MYIHMFVYISDFIVMSSFLISFSNFSMDYYMKNEFIDKILRNLSKLSRDFVNNSNKIVLIILIFSILCDPNLES